jgi:hypothetical protein
LKQAGKSIRQWWQEKRRGEEYSRVNSFSEIEAPRDPVQLKEKNVESPAKYLGVVPPLITIAARRSNPPFPTPQQQSTSLPPLHNPTPSSLFGLVYIIDFTSC